MTKARKGPHWTITSPLGNTYTVPDDDVELRMDLVDVADCDDPMAPMTRVFGDLTITAVIRADGASQVD